MGAVEEMMCVVCVCYRGVGYLLLSCQHLHSILLLFLGVQFMYTIEQCDITTYIYITVYYIVVCFIDIFSITLGSVVNTILLATSY